MEENTQTPQQIITPTPFAASAPRTKLLVSVAILIGILLLLFIAPTPYYQSEEVSCKPGQTNCPQIGWHWNKSLYQSLLGHIRYSSRSQISQVETSTPGVANPPLAETPSADLTANWKTYTNNKYQFSFKYPNNLVLLDPIGYEHTGYKNSTDFQNSLSKTTAVTDRLFEFNIDSFPKDTYPDKAKLTFDELIESEVYCGGDGVEGSFHCDKLLTSENFATNNGAQGKKLIYTIITTNSTKKSITQQQSGNIYAFNLSDTTTSRIILFHTPNFFATNSEDQKVFDQILSTFKFTK